MSQKKPETLDEYRQWLLKEHGEQISSRTATYYESVASAIARSFQESVFWVHLKDELREMDSAYLIETGYPLWASEPQPVLIIKSFESFFLKTFRRNVLENGRWPNPPKGGWLTPGNWYERVNDIVRGFLVVKYLDGVQFSVDKILDLSKACEIEMEHALEAREQGYYAAHCYFRYEVEIPRFDWDTTTITASIELQITTQLQEVIRKLTHRYYEDRRIRTVPSNQKWQWDYSSDEFIANYLGHILHYLEGMIMEVRDRQRRKG